MVKREEKIGWFGKWCIFENAGEKMKIGLLGDVFVSETSATAVIKQHQGMYFQGRCRTGLMLTETVY